jgi:hypothetical protein
MVPRTPFSSAQRRPRRHRVSGRRFLGHPGSFITRPISRSQRRCGKLESGRAITAVASSSMPRSAAARPEHPAASNSIILAKRAYFGWPSGVAAGFFGGALPQTIALIRSLGTVALEASSGGDQSNFASAN